MVGKLLCIGKDLWDFYNDPCAPWLDPVMNLLPVPGLKNLGKKAADGVRRAIPKRPRAGRRGNPGNLTPPNTRGSPA
jgi:hypothetical protein